jgi:hypothetical protein
LVDLFENMMMHGLTKPKFRSNLFNSPVQYVSAPQDHRQGEKLVLTEIATVVGRQIPV